MIDFKFVKFSDKYIGVKLGFKFNNNRSTHVVLNDIKIGANFPLLM
jgi:hypothetical protein